MFKTNFASTNFAAFKVFIYIELKTPVLYTFNQQLKHYKLNIRFLDPNHTLANCFKI